jgi:hypothetical protein
VILAYCYDDAWAKHVHGAGQSLSAPTLLALPEPETANLRGTCRRQRPGGSATLTANCRRFKYSVQLSNDKELTGEINKEEMILANLSFALSVSDDNC